MLIRNGISRHSQIVISYTRRYVKSQVHILAGSETIVILDIRLTYDEKIASIFSIRIEKMSDDSIDL